jgi:hypothetical protein
LSSCLNVWVQIQEISKEQWVCSIH